MLGELIFERCCVYKGNERTVNHRNLVMLMKLKFIKLHVSAAIQRNVYHAVRYNVRDSGYHHDVNQLRTLLVL